MESIRAILERVKTRQSESENESSTTPSPSTSATSDCAWCRGRGLRIVKADASQYLAPELALDACECSAGDQWRQYTRQQIAARENVRCVFQREWRDYANARFQDFYQGYPNAEAWIRERIERRRGIYLHGPAGRGKTRLGCAALRYCASLGLTINAIYVPAWLDDIKASFGHVQQAARGEPVLGWQTPEAVLQRPNATQAVLLDDIGAEQPTPWVASRFDRLLNDRCREGLVTIFTSNLNLGDLRDRFLSSEDLGQCGSRLASRIAGMCDVIRLDGRDWRVRG